MNKELERIAEALESIDSQLRLVCSHLISKKPKPMGGKNLKSADEQKKALGIVIGAYVTAWQDRYRTKARPELRKAYGVFKKLLEDRSADELTALLQIYCQMNDAWFVTKHHDAVTFAENIGKVAVAADKGHECGKNGERSWVEIVREREEAEKNARKRIQSPD